MKQVFVFDMDGTLMDFDSEVAWKKYMVDIGKAPAQTVAEIDKYYEDFLAGVLNEDDYVGFQLKEFRGRSVAEIAAWAKASFDRYLLPTIRPKAQRLIQECRRRGDITAIVTSTMKSIAVPVAEYFGVDYLEGSTPELVDGIYTGEVVGCLALKEGKIGLCEKISQACEVGLKNFVGFGDSINDFAMLNACGKAYAVSPTAGLAQVARERGWGILDWSLQS